MKVLTINVWSGLDYNGFFRLGDYEQAGDREARFRSLVAQVKKLDPDIIFIQEANPAGKYAAKLAGKLSMEEIHQVVNAGVKVGPVGSPFNLKEGLAILAKPGLSLGKMGYWKLYGAPGIHNDILSFQLEEVVLVLTGRISFREEIVTLVNVHLAAAPKVPDDVEGFKKKVLAAGEIDEDSFNKGLKVWKERESRRMVEVKKLLVHLEKECSSGPCIVAGDFNTGPETEEMMLFRDKGGFTDMPDHVPGGWQLPIGGVYTWDPERNRNIEPSANTRDARGKLRKGFDYLAAFVNNKARKLDYIFVNSANHPTRVLSSQVVLAGEVDGYQTSDHFGVLSEIELGQR